MVHRWALVAVVLLAPVASAYVPPALHGHVNDPAQVLEESQRRALEEELSAYRKRTGHEVAILLVRTLQNASIEDAAYDTFKVWRLGRAEPDDGVLLLVSLGDRASRIETGKGVGDRLTDAQSKRILREQMRPLLQAGKVYEALAVGARSIEAALEGAEAAAPPASTPLTFKNAEQALWFVGGFSFLFCGLSVLAFVLILRGILRWVERNGVPRWLQGGGADSGWGWSRDGSWGWSRDWSWGDSDRDSRDSGGRSDSGGGSSGGRSDSGGGSSGGGSDFSSGGGGESGGGGSSDKW